MAHVGVTNTDADHLNLMIRTVCRSSPTRSASRSSTGGRRAARRGGGGHGRAPACLRNPRRRLPDGPVVGRRSRPRARSRLSKSKYRRSSTSIGGWPALQRSCRPRRRSRRSTASRSPTWRPGGTGAAGRSGHHRRGPARRAGAPEDNARLFAFALDAEDHARLDEAFRQTRPVPGDCGDEYRRPPFLTASGTSATISTPCRRSMPASRCRAGRAGCGCPRQRLGAARRLHRASGPATPSRSAAPRRPTDRAPASRRATRPRRRPTSWTRSWRAWRHSAPRARTWCGRGSTSSTPRTGKGVSRVHGHVFGEVRPANTLIEISGLVGEGYRVEIEADAIVGS